MLKRLKSVSMMLFLMGASTGAAYAVANPGITDVKITQQNGSCTGIVKDKTGETVIGASVVVKGTTNGTITGIDGNFALSGVKKGDIIVVSFVGYQTQEVAWDGKPLDITLKDDTQTLAEVVVTALGLPKQAKSVGYATTRVSTSEIERASALSPVTALQGKVAGVQINVGGASGITSSSSITIRGAKSVDKNNSPIWVVDGMVIQEALTGYGAGTDWGSQLKNLNPADYESVTVLKGAAATALYGSRGANGAIVIVSKGGKFGKKGLGVEVNQSVEWTDVYDSPFDLQNEFGAGSISAFQGDFQSDGSLYQTTSSWGPAFDGELRNQWMPNGEMTPYVAHPDNWKEFYQTGVNSTTNVAISGGGEKSSFRISYGYTDNKGVFKGNDFSRHNIQFRGLTDLNDIFSIEMGVKYGFSEAKNGANQQAWGWNTNVGLLTAYYLPRNYDIAAHIDQYRLEDGSVESTSLYGNGTYLNSYLHRIDTQTDKRSEQSLLADITLRAKIAPWLTASIKANYNYYSINTESKYVGTGAGGGPAYSGGYSRGGSTSGNYNFMAMLQSTDNKFNIAGEEITLSAIIAGEMYGNTVSNSWSKATNGGLVVPGVFAFSNSRNQIVPKFDYTPANERTIGLSGIINLGWRDQVFLEITGRNDWLSTLTYPTYALGAKNNYTVFYPSFNASWVFTDTFRDQMPEWFSMGKLRASWAQVGMGTSAYATVKGYGVYNQGSIYLPDKSGSVLYANPNLGTAYNSDLKPEIQSSIEIGTDLRFFDERLTLDLAYYKTNTKNQIMSVGSVLESGSNSKLINAGNIQNQGVEIQIEGTPIRTSDWRWSIGGNFTLNRGKIVELDPEVKEWCLLGNYDGGAEIWAYEGGEFGVLTTSQNSSSFSPIVRDEQGRMILKNAGQYGSANPVPRYTPLTRYLRNEEGDRDRHVVGKVEPDFTLSLNTSLSYKDFDLYIQGDGRFGGNYFSHMWKYTAPTGNLKSTLKGRSKEHGGIKRINYKGETVYDALMLDAVFAEGEKAPLMNPDGTLGDMVDVGGKTYKEAVENMGIYPVMAAAWYQYNSNRVSGIDSFGPVQDNTWFALREITLGYRLPERICEKFGANYLRLGFTARNLCYIINKLNDGLNPASISSNNPLMPMDIGAVPFSRTFAFNLTVRF